MLRHSPTPRPLHLAYALSSLGLVALPFAANAGTVDAPHFDVPPLVIVWAADDDTGASPLVVDLIADVGGVETDLITTDGRTLVSGSLLPTNESFVGAATGENWIVKDALGATLRSLDTSNPATFNAFDVTGATAEIQGATSRVGYFFVASNTAFNIRSDTLSALSDGDFSTNDITFSMHLDVTGTHGGLAFGADAQDPAVSHSAASFPLNAYYGGAGTLQAANGADVFVGTQATALSDGTISEQSVRFRPQYILDDDLFLDLSNGTGEVQAEVAYTVYVP